MASQNSLDKLLWFDCEIFGRWSDVFTDILPRFAYSKTESLLSRTKCDVSVLVLKRWASLLGVAFQ